MISPAAFFATTPPVGLSTGGTSSAARYIAKRRQELRAHVSRPHTLDAPTAVVKRDLGRIFSECSEPNWDGYNALPVEEETYRTAYVFVDALPSGTPMPSAGVEADGHLTLEWHRSARRTLSVSVSPAGDLHYAALLGNGKVAGTEAFLGEMPKAIQAVLRRVYAG